MAHKARRRPSWKKPRAKYFKRSSWERAWEEFIEREAKRIRKQIDENILAEILKNNCL